MQGFIEIGWDADTLCVGILLSEIKVCMMCSCSWKRPSFPLTLKRRAAAQCFVRERNKSYTVCRIPSFASDGIRPPSRKLRIRKKDTTIISAPTCHLTDEHLYKVVDMNS